jgi:hypothetical protein
MTDGGRRGDFKFRSAARHYKWSDARGICARIRVSREAANVLTGAATGLSVLRSSYEESCRSAADPNIAVLPKPADP